MVSRAEHRRSTLLRLADAAVDLFEERHPEQPTAEEIAERAEVSRRTVFRYVDAKEDLAFVRPILWLDIFDAAVAEVADGTIRERIVHGANRISRDIDADPEPVRRALLLASRTPGMAGRYGAVNQRWVQRIAAEIAGDDADAETRFRAHVLGAAVMGVIDAALAEWVDDPDRRLVDIVDRGLEYLAPILDG
ncbi:MAG: TetR family transcriptional regulator [Actinomycetota bacterium]